MPLAVTPYAAALAGEEGTTPVGSDLDKQDQQLYIETGLRYKPVYKVLAMQSHNLRSLKETQQLTHEYASYSLSRNGLGNVLGGIAYLVTFLISEVMASGIWTSVMTLALLMMWVIGKEIIRLQVYQAFGLARLKRSFDKQVLRIFSVGAFALIAVGLWLVIIEQGWLPDPRAWLLLPLLTAMPWIAWNYLRTAGEVVIALPLSIAVLDPVVIQFGDRIELIMLIIATTLIVIGIVEHLHFRSLAARLQSYQHMEDV